MFDRWTKSLSKAWSITDLVKDHSYEWQRKQDLFTDPDSREKQMKMDEVVDLIRKRFGFYSIQRADVSGQSIVSL